MRLSREIITLLAIAVVFVALVMSAADSVQPLAPVIARAFSEGKDAKINASFARTLGLKTEQPLALKRLLIKRSGTTNVFNVLVQDRKTIILFDLQQPLRTYYLTDASGILKRAVINDSNIADGGLTNLTLSAAATGFAKQRQLWIEAGTR